jgi:hypothetical protein
MSAIDFDKIDSQVLQIVNLLIEQLQIRDFKPSRVSWEGYVIGGLGTYTGPRVRLAPPGLCLFTWDEVMLTGGLKGRLEPEEWRPLLASSLIYEAKLKPKKTLGIVATAVASIILDLAVISLLALLDPKGAVYFVIPAFLGSVVWLLFGIPFVNPFLRSLRLKADMVATQLVGKEPLIQVLENINGMELEDKDIGGRLARRPSLEERIENLRPL